MRAHSRAWSLITSRRVLARRCARRKRRRYLLFDAVQRVQRPLAAITLGIRPEWQQQLQSRIRRRRNCHTVTSSHLCTDCYCRRQVGSNFMLKNSSVLFAGLMQLYGVLRKIKFVVCRLCIRHKVGGFDVFLDAVHRHATLTKGKDLLQRVLFRRSAALTAAVG